MFPGKFHFILWVIAIIIHLILLLSAWDMFPAKNNYAPLNSSTEDRHTAGGKRAVIFLIGALNATAFYRTMNNMEYSLINSIVMETGSWGIAWSTDKTTSSDNIKCLLSGTINDDIPWFSDSYKQPDDLSRYMKEIVYIGPTIIIDNLQMNTSNWQIHTYPKNWDKYTKKYDDVAMDTWVTEQTNTILNDVKFRKTLSNDKTLFIVYFDGVKIINKYEGKYSPRISDAVKRILLNIEKIVYNFKTAFKNEETVYILASDYTTSDIKEYAKETPSYVATPILAWGAQIAGPLLTKSKEWPMLIKDRKDVDHKDLTTLLACILGTPTPAHSVGQLPFTYLQNNSSMIARCALSNIKQLQTLYRNVNDNINGKALLKISNMFAPIDKNTIDNLYSMFINNIDHNKYNVVLDESETLILRIINGIKHYKYYYTRMAKLLIVSMYSGWLIYLSCDMLRSATAETINTAARPAEDTQSTDKRNTVKSDGITQEGRKEQWSSLWKRLVLRTTKLTFLIDLLYIFFSLLLLTIVILGAWPFRLIIYLSTLLCIWWTVIKYSKRISCKKIIFIRNDTFASVKFCAFLMLLILICSFFLNNIVLTAIILIIMLTFPFIDFKEVKNCYLGDWMLSSIILIFSLCYSSDLRANLTWILLQTGYWIIFSLLTSVIFQIKLVDYPLLVLSLIAIILATVINCLLKEHIIIDNFWIWLLTLIFILNIFVGSNTLIIRLLQNGICLCIPYIMKAKGYEPITYLSIILHLTTWIAVETYQKNNDEEKLPIMHEIPEKSRENNKNIQWNDERRAFLCTIYLLVCYSALGNQKNIINLFTNIEMTSYSYTNWAPLMMYLVKLTCITLTVTMFYLMINKISCTNMKTELLCLLTIMAYMGYVLLIIALIMNTLTTNYQSVSDYIFSQFLILAFLITYPLNLCLTSTSLLKWTAKYNEARTPTIPRHIS